MKDFLAVGGIDPGPRSGLVILHLVGGTLLRVERGPHLTWQRVVASSTHVAVEKYVRGRVSVRTRDSAAQLETQSVARAAMEACVAGGRVLQALPAGAVKPWADDERLKAYRVGVLTKNQREDQRPTLYELTRGGGGHDRDSARHALNFAVKLGLLPKL